MSENDRYELRCIIYGALIGLIMIMIMIALLLGGCNSQLHDGNNPISPGTKIIYETIRSTDWLISLFLIGCVAGLFAGLNGLKIGWLGAASCIGGILIKSALSTIWIYWFMSFCLAGCILAVIASILLKNKALIEIIKGVQKAKDGMVVVDGENPAKVALEVELGHQSKPTQKLVQLIKGDLKVKGEI